jgi:hypothetical protein
MRMLLGLLVVCASCVEMDGDPPDAEERSGTTPRDHAGVLQRTDPPASCVATAAMAAQQASSFDAHCHATVDVAVTCSARAQDNLWIRIGVIADADVTTYDTQYACNKTLSHAFVVPCDAASIVGGAVFDHPQSGDDVACLSPAI